MGSLLAVDGNSLAHRAWHALKSEGLDGAWVTHGVVRMLATAWRHGPFDGVVVAFDSPRSLRRARDPAYKANRGAHDPALHEQLSLLADLLARCGCTVLTAAGYEADDLLAATAHACTDLAVRCHLLSSDRDLLALVSPTVTLLRPRRTMADMTVHDPAAVETEFGIAPAKYLHLAALRGDPSDNLPGVRGIGTRTAARLLRSWGSIEGIYAGLFDIPPAVAARLRAGRQQVERNLALMTPQADHDVDVPGVLARGVDVERVCRTLEAVGLGAAAASFRHAVARGPLPPLPPPPEVDPTDHGRPARHATTRSGSRTPVAVEGEQAALFDLAG
ncbi:MAG TPA: 5'-3' exonuclease H3TH domain-containing protein [Nitriliruptorales bacterium]|nr:5'-3' exonuclease H3TH domain-containing protein [Nitriliruptorales bacterium]